MTASVRGVSERPTVYRVVDHIVDYLAAGGVSHIFGVDGANIEDLYDAAYFCDGITAVLAKHEFSAATMADGYSRSGAGLGTVAGEAGEEQPCAMIEPGSSSPAAIRNAGQYTQWKRTISLPIMCTLAGQYF